MLCVDCSDHACFCKSLERETTTPLLTMINKIILWTLTVNWMAGTAETILKW